MHFFLCEFVHMRDEIPGVRALGECIATLHSRSWARSPNGMFGFHVTTYNGLFPQHTAWSSSWEAFFIETLRSAFALEKKVHAPSLELTELTKPLLEKVCPRLLRPLETEGRVILPTLVHGDLWDNNTGVLTRTGAPCVFDASALWAHNEYELHSWRGDNFKIGKDYTREYFKHIPPSAPEEDWEDRNQLYGLMTDVLESYLFKDTTKFRRFLIDNMRALVDKYPHGYKWKARCKTEENAESVLRD